MATRSEDGLPLVRVPPWRRPAVHWSVLYVGIPLAIALLFTLMRAGLAALMPFRPGLLVWVLLVMPAWWTAQLASAVVHRVLRPWTPPLWAICVLGSIGQALLLSPYYRALFAWADGLTTSGRLHGDWPLPEFTLAYAAALVWSMAPGATLWTVVNYFYDRVLGVPRFRYEHATTAGAAPLTERQAGATAAAPVPTPAGAPAPAAASGPARSATASTRALLQRSRLPREAVIVAVTAEEHYVRLYTDRGHDLVRYRFSDALQELADEPTGMQVHRSWWVRLDAVQRCRDRGRSCELAFADGLRVPVSHAFREAVRTRLPSHARRPAGGET